jgi:hypothetical protein
VIVEIKLIEEYNDSEDSEIRNRIKIRSYKTSGNYRAFCLAAAS